MKPPPAPLHRMLYRVAHGLRRLYWRVRRPTVNGVRVLALDARGRLLLVRHAYGSTLWMPPSGGLGRGEDPAIAAARELAEETGCSLRGALFLALSEEDLHGARNRVHIVRGEAQGQPRPDHREIIAARFFALDALPAEMPASLAKQLRKWLAPPA